MPLPKKPPLTNVRLSGACQTLSAKNSMESALVSPDTVALSRDALQLTWLCRKGAKVWHAHTIRSVHPTIASLESAKSSMSHQAPH